MGRGLRPPVPSCARRRRGLCESLGCPRATGRRNRVRVVELHVQATRWYWLIRPSRMGCRLIRRTSARLMIGRVTHSLNRGRSLISRLVRTMIIIVVGVLGEDLGQMLLVEDQHVLEHLPAERSDNPLADRVRPGDSEISGPEPDLVGLVLQSAGQQVAWVV